MNNNLPSPIMNDGDLESYENYLKNRDTAPKNEKQYPVTIENSNMSYIPSENRNVSERLRNTAFMPAFLSKHIGKLIRVEFYLGNQLHSRTGILMTVGDSFIVLRAQNNTTLVCDSDSIRFVTIIHDNDFKRLMSNY